MKIPTQIWIFCVGIFLQHYTFLQKRTFCILCEKFFHFVRKATLDYWHLLDITYYDDLNDFLEKTKGGRYFLFSTKGTHIHSDAEYPDNCYIIFGKETKGLPEELLMQYPESTVRIPMIDEARSLNLSNSVAIATYEVLRQWNYPQLQSIGELHNHKWSDVLK